MTASWKRLALLGWFLALILQVFGGLGLYIRAADEVGSLITMAVLMFLTLADGGEI